MQSPSAWVSKWPWQCTGRCFLLSVFFFLHLFEGLFPIYLTQREIWKVVEMFFLSLKIATLFSITYPYLLGNQFYNTQTAVSLEPTCGVLFISWGKQTLNMAWTFGVSEWWSQSFSDIFFWGNQTGCILECQFFQIMGTMSGSSGLLVFTQTWLPLELTWNVFRGWSTYTSRAT